MSKVPSLLCPDADRRLVRARGGAPGPRELDGVFARLSWRLDVDIGATL